MLYNAPTGGASNDPYIGKNVAAGIQGSKIPPAAAEYPQREIVNAITAAGIAPTNSDLQQLTRAIRSGVLEYYVDTGAANAPTIAPSPAHTSLVDGFHIRVKMAHPPTGPVTQHVNSLSAPVVRLGGLACVGNEWNAGDVIDLVLVGGQFQICGLTVNDLASSLASLLPPTTALIHKGDDTGAANAIVVAVVPAISSYQEGHRHEIKLAHDLSGATVPVANICGLGNRNIVRADGTPVQTGDRVAGEMLDLIDDGTQLVIAGLHTPSANSAVEYTTGNQGVANATTTNVLLNGTDPPFGSSNGGNFTVTSAGVYNVSCSISFNIASTQSPVTLFANLGIQINNPGGSLIAGINVDRQSQGTSSALSGAMSCSLSFYCGVGFKISANVLFADFTGHFASGTITSGAVFISKER